MVVTATMSAAGSTFTPISVTRAPFTVTRPATISSSAWRREATPARARNFCNLISAMAGDLLVVGLEDEGVEVDLVDDA